MPKTIPNNKNPQLDITKYRGEWLALHPETNRIVAHNPSFEVARKSAKRLGVARPVLYAVPKSDSYFVARANL